MGLTLSRLHLSVAPQFRFNGESDAVEVAPFPIALIGDDDLPRVSRAEWLSLVGSLEREREMNYVTVPNWWLSGGDKLESHDFSQGLTIIPHHFYQLND